MLSTMLGFGGRIGRLSYFLLTLGLALAMTLLVLAVVFTLAPEFATSSGSLKEPPNGLILITAAIVLPIFLWFTLALSSKRFRDIGWKPLYVIPAWTVTIAIDWFVASAVPSLATGEGDQTIAGAVINLVMFACLLFWPGGRNDDSFGRVEVDEPAASSLSRPAKVSSPRHAAPSVAHPSGFGRRGT